MLSSLYEHISKFETLSIDIYLCVITFVMFVSQKQKIHNALSNAKAKQ